MPYDTFHTRNNFESIPPSNQAKPAVTSPAPLGEQTLLFPPATFTAILRFLKQCWQGGGGGYSDQYRCVLEHAMATEGTWALHATSAHGLMELGAADAEVGMGWEQGSVFFSFLFEVYLFFWGILIPNLLFVFVFTISYR